MTIKPPNLLLPKLGKALIKAVGWILTVLMLLLNLYQYRQAKVLEEQLQLSRQQILHAQVELAKAKVAVDTLERNLETYTSTDNRLTISTDSLLQRWRNDLKSLKSQLNTDASP